MLVAFAGDADGEPFPVDVFGFDAERLAHAESALVDDGEIDPVTFLAHGLQQGGDIIAGQHVRERFITFDLDLAPDRPVAFEVIAVEGAKRADCLVDGVGCEVALGMEMEQEIEDLVFVEVRRLDRAVDIVAVDLFDPAQVGILGAGLEVLQLHEALKFLEPWL